MNRNRWLFFLTGLLTLWGNRIHGQTYSLLSPNQQIGVQVSVGMHLEYRVTYLGRAILDSCQLGLSLQDGQQLGLQAKVQKETRRSVRDTLRPIVPEKRALIPDQFNELTLHFKGNFALLFRAYDDGVAYRLVSSFKDSITILNETARFHPASSSVLYYASVNKRGDADIFHTSFEAPYKIARLDTLPGADLAFSPVLFSPEAGPKILLTDTVFRNEVPALLAKSCNSRIESSHVR